MPLNLNSIAERVKKAGTHLLLDAIFVGTCLKKLQVVVDTTCDTAWTDGVSLGYNPAYVDQLHDAALVGLLFHEVMHVTNGHCWRRKGRDADDWNIACDLAINLPILACGYQLPPGGYVDQKYKGKSAEYIYHARKQEEAAQAKPQPEPQNGNGQGEAGDPKDGEDAAPAAAGEKPEKVSPATPGAGSGEPGEPADESPAGNSGSGAGEKEPTQNAASSGADDQCDGKSEDSDEPAGAAKPAVDPKAPTEADAAPGQQASDGKDKDGTPRNAGKPKAPKPAGEVRDAPSGVDARKLEKEWQVTITQAANAARMMGKLPGALAAMVPQMVKPKVDWRSVFRLFMQQAWNSNDYTWRMPNSRYLSQGMYLPRLHSTSLPCVVIFEDISGSVPAGMKAAFHAEERDIIEEIQPDETYLGYCDAAVRHTVHYRPGDPIKVISVTAGGTDFRPAFEWVEAQGLTPVAFVYLTDLEGTFPAEAPDYPVLWVTPPTNLTVPFGEIVEMRD